MNTRRGKYPGYTLRFYQQEFRAKLFKLSITWPGYNKELNLN